MSSIPDHYETLGVSPSATGEVVAAAYKALIRSTHPDQAVDDDDRSRRQERAARLGEAFATLKDPAARARYDARRAAETGSPATPAADPTPADVDAAWAAARAASAPVENTVIDADILTDEPPAPSYTPRPASSVRSRPPRGPITGRRPTAPPGRAPGVGAVAAGDSSIRPPSGSPCAPA